MWIISFIYYFYSFCFVSFSLQWLGTDWKRVKLANIQKKLFYLFHLLFHSFSVLYFFTARTWNTSSYHILFGRLLFCHYWSFFFLSRFKVKPNHRKENEKKIDLCDTILLQIAYDFKWQNWNAQKMCRFCCWFGQQFFFLGKTSRQTFLPVLPAYLEHCFAFQLKFRIKFVSQ